ncbi:MAG: ABC transporter permease [Oscillospiraceae bacterium]
MFWTIYWNRIKASVRTKDLLVWTWIFPIMLSTLFYFAFANLDSVNTFEAVPTAVVDDSAYRSAEGFRQTLESVSAEGGEQLIALTKVPDLETADRLLEADEVEGYIVVQDGKPELKVKANGIGQTILKKFLDQYLQTASALETMAEQNPAALEQTELLERTGFTYEISLTERQPTDKINYFYALLAMVCMYGGFQGMQTVVYLQANLSPLGARRMLAPVSRLRVIVCDMLGGLTVHFVCLLIVVGYIALVLGVSFGSQLLYILLVCLLGSLVGVGMGAAVGALFRWSEIAKTAILVTVTMVCSFFAGLMTTGINYMVERIAPAAAWINPAARIVDAFYCLYYYDTYERFFADLAVLAAMSVFFFAVAGAALRRKSYESI